MRKHNVFLLVLLLAFSTLIITSCEKKEDAGKQQQTKVSTTTVTEKEVNANWTIEIDDKVSVEQQGLPMEFTLQLNATKAGGTDPIGKYKGSAHLAMKADVSKFKGVPQSIIKTMGNIDGVVDAKDLKFDVIDFSKARKSDSKSSSSSSVNDDDALAPLGTDDGDGKTTDTLPSPSGEDKAVSNPDYYSSGVMEMSGTENFDVKATGIQGESAQVSKQANAGDNILFYMNIVGATVYVDIPKAGRFKGTVTGDPIK